MKVKDPAAIRRWRKQRHFSQEDLAYLVRRDQSTISLIERGGMSSLSEDLALAIAARLDVPWDELFEVREHKPEPSIASSKLSTRARRNVAAV